MLAITLLLAAADPVGAHELVVRFPGNVPPYNHVYSNLKACQRGRQAVLDEFKQRMADNERDAMARGAIGFVPSTPPAAICVPL